MKTRTAALIMGVGLVLAFAFAAVQSSLTARSRFTRQLDAALWTLRQQSAERLPISAEERWRYLEQLRSPNEYDRWDAAAKLASWGDTSAVPHLVAAMLDDAGTRRTCVIAQSLGTLGSSEAVPALLGALNHPRNLDLRVCATHALAEIGDGRAVPVLAERARLRGDEAAAAAQARSRSLTPDDSVSAIIALGDLGAVEALPVLREMAANDPDETMRSLAASSARKIQMLRASDPVVALLAALDETPSWIADEWLLKELHKRWDSRVAAALNRYVLRVRVSESDCIYAASLLLHHGALRDDTAQMLADSTETQHQWLAAYASAHRDSVTLARTTP